MRPRPEHRRGPAFLAIISGFMLAMTLTLIITNVCCAWNWNPLTWGQAKTPRLPLFDQPITSAVPNTPLSVSFTPSASMEVSPGFNRCSLAMYDDKIASTATKTQIELSAKTTILNRLELKYTVMPAIKWTDTQTVTGEVLIGDMKFGKKGSGENQQPTTTDLSCEFSGSLQRVELALTSRLPIRPIVVAEFPALHVEATGKVDEKVVTASDTFRQSLVGLGAELTFNPGYRFSEAVLKGAFSDRLTLAEGKIGLNMLDFFRVDAGYRYHRTKMNNGVWTDQGLFIQGGMLF
jgi:hypothetical protein